MSHPVSKWDKAYSIEAMTFFWNCIVLFPGNRTWPSKEIPIISCSQNLLSKCKFGDGWVFQWAMVNLYMYQKVVILYQKATHLFQIVQQVGYLQMHYFKENINIFDTHISQCFKPFEIYAPLEEDKLFIFHRGVVIIIG